MRKAGEVRMDISADKLDALATLLKRIIPSMQSDEEVLLKECYVDVLFFVSGLLDKGQRKYRLALNGVRAVALMQLGDYSADFQAYEGVVVNEIVHKIDLFKKNNSVKNGLR